MAKAGGRKPRDIAALIAFIDTRQGAPHEWGRKANDCASFADGAVKAQTGRGALGKVAWSNKAGALKTLKKLGGMEAALDSKFERVPIALAKRGDIAGVPIERIADAPTDERKLIALHPMIVEGLTLATPGPKGLRRVPRHLATVAWDIGKRKRKP